MTDNRTAEPTTTEHLRALLDERGVEWKSGRVYNNNTSWNVGDSRIIAKELTDGTLLIQQYSRKHFTPEQAIAATLGSEREAELARAMEDVLRHSTDTVWVGEAETLVDRMVSLGVYKHDVYEGVRPWEATNE